MTIEHHILPPDTNVADWTMDQLSRGEGGTLLVAGSTTPDTGEHYVSVADEEDCPDLMLSLFLIMMDRELADAVSFIGFRAKGRAVNVEDPDSSFETLVMAVFVRPPGEGSRARMLSPTGTHTTTNVSTGHVADLVAAIFNCDVEDFR